MLKLCSVNNKLSDTDHIKVIKLDNDTGDSNHCKNPGLKIENLVCTFQCKFYRNANRFYAHNLRERERKKERVLSDVRAYKNIETKIHQVESLTVKDPIIEQIPI